MHNIHFDSKKNFFLRQRHSYLVDLPLADTIYSL